MSDQIDNTLHTKYRPETLDQIIGHTAHVQRLRGMIKQNKLPGAFLFTGPSSVGKTTLARALAMEINKTLDVDYKELNGADTRTIEDMRDLIKLSKFRPSKKKKIFVIDEAQQVLSNAPAAAALLKPIEDAGKTDSIWILCSMDPSKFGSGNGKAIANRCTQFVLEQHSDEDLLAQAVRIVKGEGMSYLKDKELLKKVVESSNSEMRTLANLLQGIRDYAEGMDKLPKLLDEKAIGTVLQSAEDQDDTLIADIIAGALTGKFGLVQKSLLGVADGFQCVNKLMWASSTLLNLCVLEGARHPKVWPSAITKGVAAKTKGLKISLGLYAGLAEVCVNLKVSASSFAVGEKELISARLYRFIVDNRDKFSGK